MTKHDALILMAKAPLPGQVKTRLSPPFTKRAAASLYACLLEDTAREMAGLKRVRRFLFYSPPGSGRFFRGEPFSRFELVPQSGRDLGERMAAAFETAFTLGSGRTVLVGADCPVLSASLVRVAFRELASTAGAVFGPSEDGGFYLVGLSTPVPSLFRDVRWGTSTVFSEVSGRCREAGISYSLLRPAFDIDTPEDIGSLVRWARTCSVPACPRTRKWLISRGDG